MAARLEAPENLIATAAIDLEQPDSLSAALAPMQARLLERPVDVVLDDGLVRFFVARPALGLADFGELKAIVAARFEDLFGFDATGWRIEADWHASRPFLACAVREALLLAIDAAVVRRTSVAPVFVHCLRHLSLHKGNVWFATRTGSWTTAACFDQHEIQHVRSAALSPDADLTTWLADEAILVDQPLKSLLVAEPRPFPATARDFEPHRLDGPPAALQLVDRLRESEVAA